MYTQLQLGGYGGGRYVRFDISQPNPEQINEFELIIAQLSSTLLEIRSRIEIGVSITRELDINISG